MYYHPKHHLPAGQLVHSGAVCRRPFLPFTFSHLVSGSFESSIFLCSVEFGSPYASFNVCPVVQNRAYEVDHCHHSKRVLMH